MNEENKNENIGQVPQDVTQSTPQDTSQSTSRDATQNTPQDLPQDVTQSTPQSIPQDATQNIPKEVPQEEIPSTLQDDKPVQGSYGPLVGVIIIILVLIAGGIYLWSSETYKKSNQLPTIQSGEEADVTVTQQDSQSTSDEIIDIEKDLDTTELDNLDSELGDLLNEL